MSRHCTDGQRLVRDGNVSELAIGSATTGAVAIVATLDTKGREAFYLADIIEACGRKAILIDVGTKRDGANKQADAKAPNEVLKQIAERTRSKVGDLPGSAMALDVEHRKLVRLGYIKAGETISELAKQLGLDSAELKKTIEEHNAHAARGRDPLLNGVENGFQSNLRRSDRGKNPNLGPNMDGHLSRFRSFRQRLARPPDWRPTVTEASWVHKATQSRVFMLAAPT
ncbi:Uncharacterised protein family (UPF0261) [Bradyrhizobium shewense]|uniref:Uncharacterized protein family (UPF0261) n=1 Tax=Bradyrhizobium shewense TaxID=1761772 RepID=A0A1C3XHN4_9BRAD|nr:Uncharacterised protein family (UPF0261) [Bradyrhizobium shewense]